MPENDDQKLNIIFQKQIPKKEKKRKIKTIKTLTKCKKQSENHIL